MRGAVPIALLAIVLAATFSCIALTRLGTLQASYSIAPAEIEALEDREYYWLLIDDVRSARREVLVAMYLMKYDPDDPQDWANDLIRELVAAKERGVEVKVIIEHRTYRGYMDVNLDAYRYLKGHGVEVKLDEDLETDHFKLVIIDGRIVYVGSHNWSEAALYYNREVSVRIVDEGVARELRDYFNSLWGS